MAPAGSACAANRSINWSIQGWNRGASLRSYALATTVHDWAKS